MTCSLHFTLWTDSDNKHKAINLWCPECGTRGNKLVYKQAFKAPIFQKMPGAAMLNDVHLHERKTNATEKGT